MMAADFPELDAMIAAGWGDTSQKLIPSDWRTRRGPAISFSPERKANVGAGVGKKRWGWNPMLAKQPKQHYKLKISTKIKSK